MKKYIILFLFLYPSVCLSDPIVIRPPDFDHALNMIRKEVDVRKLLRTPVQVDVSDSAVTFISKQPLKVKPVLEPGQLPTEEDEFFEVRTIFLLKSPTIEKRVHVRQGKDRDEMARMRFTLKTDADKPFENFLYNGLGSPMQVYNRPGEMVMYIQHTGTQADVDVKEWIYARKPNSPAGSKYLWKVQSEEFYRRVVLEPDPKGQVQIKRQVVVQGVDPQDYKKQRHVIDAIYSVQEDNKIYIAGEDTVGMVEPVFYITKEGRRKAADFRIIDRNQLSIEINEPAKNYPILIESN